MGLQIYANIYGIANIPTRTSGIIFTLYCSQVGVCDQSSPATVGFNFLAWTPGCHFTLKVHREPISPKRESFKTRSQPFSGLSKYMTNVNAIHFISRILVDNPVIARACYTSCVCFKTVLPAVCHLLCIIYQTVFYLSPQIDLLQ